MQADIEAGITGSAGWFHTRLPAREPIQLVAGVNMSANITYQWTYPSGFNSPFAEPQVDDPGEYVLDVTVDGCSAPSGFGIRAKPAYRKSAAKLFPAAHFLAGKGAMGYGIYCRCAQRSSGRLAFAYILK